MRGKPYLFIQTSPAKRRSIRLQRAGSQTSEQYRRRQGVLYTFFLAPSKNFNPKAATALGVLGYSVDMNRMSNVFAHSTTSPLALSVNSNKQKQHSLPVLQHYYSIRIFSCQHCFSSEKNIFQTSVTPRKLPFQYCRTGENLSFRLKNPAS